MSDSPELRGSKGAPARAGCIAAWPDAADSVLKKDCLRRLRLRVGPLLMKLEARAQGTSLLLWIRHGRDIMTQQIRWTLVRRNSGGCMAARFGGFAVSPALGGAEVIGV